VFIDVLNCDSVRPAVVGSGVDSGGICTAIFKLLLSLTRFLCTSGFVYRTENVDMRR
jgi:hypothetical protein